MSMPVPARALITLPIALTTSTICSNQPTKSCRFFMPAGHGMRFNSMARHGSNDLFDRRFIPIARDEPIAGSGRQDCHAEIQRLQIPPGVGGRCSRFGYLQFERDRQRSGTIAEWRAIGERLWHSGLALYGRFSSQRAGSRLSYGFGLDCCRERYLADTAACASACALRPDGVRQQKKSDISLDGRHRCRNLSCEACDD